MKFSYKVVLVYKKHDFDGKTKQKLLKITLLNIKPNFINLTNRLFVAAALLIP